MKFKTVWEKIGNEYKIDRTYTDFYADQIALEKSKLYNKKFISIAKGKNPNKAF